MPVEQRYLGHIDEVVAARVNGRTVDFRAGRFDHQDRVVPPDPLVAHDLVVPVAQDVRVEAVRDITTV